MTPSIHVVSVPFSKPPPKQSSTVYQLRNSIEVTTSAYTANTSGLRRGNEQYRVDPATGEILEYVPYQNRANSLKSSYKTVRRLVLNNFQGGLSEIFATLTYGSGRNPLPAELYQDFRAFWDRFRYHYPGCQYLAVFEPHADGRFHIHCLVKRTDGRILSISQARLQWLWRQGNVDVGPIRNVIALAHYLGSKAQKYPERLIYFPPRFRLYRRSRGIISPAPQKLSRIEVDKLVEGGKYHLDYANAVSITTTDNGREIQLNQITYEFFRR